MLVGLILSLAAIGIGVSGYLIWPMFSAGLPVTTPNNLEPLSEELRTLIEQHVEATRRYPKDARQRATLGLVYEANEFWPEALSCYINATALQRDEPMWPHHAAIVWLETGDMAGATSWLQEHAARFARFAPMQHRLGLVLLDANELEEAQAAFERVIESAPQIASGYVGYGDAKIRSGDPKSAVEALEKAVGLDPTNKNARYLLGRAYRSLGRLKDAEREMTLGMGSGRKYLLDSWSKELSNYTTGLASLRESAVDLIKAGRPAEAAKILIRIVSDHPTDVDAAINLGIAYLNMGRLEEAEAVLLEAEQLDENRFEVYINLAACCRRLQRPTDALRYVNRAIELSPTAAQAHLTRGMIFLQIRNNESALTALKTAQSFDAGNPKIVQELANACVRLDRLPEALAYYQTLARLLPNRWEPYLGIAKTYYGLDMLEESASAVTEGLGLAPNEPRLMAMARHLRESQNR